MMSKKDMKKIKPLKKKHKGLKIFLIVLCVILVLPIAFIFIAFYDPKSKDVSDTDVHYENLVSQVFYKGLQNLDPINPELKFTINEEMIDGIMMAACDKINQKQWIPKMYCYIDDNNYTFVMDAQASFFKTRAFINTTLDKDDESILTFQINKITIGRLPIPMNWVTGLLGNFVNDEMLNNAFSKSGFRIESHLSENKLIYSRKNFKEDVGSYISKLGDGEGNQFLNVLLSTFDNDEVLTADYKDGVSVGLNLAKLMIDTTKYKCAPLEFNDLESHKTEVAYLLNNGLEEKDAPIVFKYLLRGKDSFDEIDNLHLSDELLTAIKSHISKGYPGETLETYKGSDVIVTPAPDDPITRFAGYCAEKLGKEEVFGYDPSSPTSASFNLPTNRLNQVLAANLKSVIGKTVPITFKEDDQWYFEYITVDNVYTGISGNETAGYNFNIYLRLNISGSPVTLVISTNKIGFEVATDDKLGHLKFELKDIYFGSIKIEDNELIDSIVNLIPDDGAVFKYNPNKKQFEVSIDDLATLQLDSNIISAVKSIINDQTTKITQNYTLEGDTLKLTYTKGS